MPYKDKTMFYEVELKPQRQITITTYLGFLWLFFWNKKRGISCRQKVEEEKWCKANETLS